MRRSLLVDTGAFVALRVLCCDADDGEQAERLLRRFTDQAVSYTDALTLAVARRYDVGAIFAFDHHLAMTGVPLLPNDRSRRS